MARVPLISIEAATTRHHDMIIVGAGVAGSAMAAAMARSGRSVLLIERSFEVPDRIVGGVIALQRLGLHGCLDGIDACICRGYTVFWGNKNVNIPYPEKSVEVEGFEDGQSSSSMRNEGVQEGRSFHHGAFVDSLRRAAALEKRVDCFEATVTDLVRCVDSNRIIGVRASPTAQTAELSSPLAPEMIDLLAPMVIFVDGCFSKFRRVVLPEQKVKPVVRSHFVGLILKDADLPDPGHGHVILPKSEEASPDAIGPVLVYQLDPGETRMLIDVPGDKAPSMSGGQLQKRLERQVLPMLPERLAPSFEQALAASKDASAGSSRLRAMPNSWLPPHAQHKLPAVEGCMLAGDALSMRHPLTGGGMTVALTDVVHLVEALGGGLAFADMPAQEHPVDLQDWAAVASACRRWYHDRKPLASTINVLAQALYQLFGANDDDLEVLKQGCFGYFELGGECVQGPISLLSALSPGRLKLFCHFFAVALYSIYLLFVPKTTDTPAKRTPVFRLARRSLSVFATACVVFLPVLWREF